MVGLTVLLMIHAAAGVAALAVGALALGRPHLVGAHLMLLMTCIGSLVGLIAVDWGSLDRISRALFVALGLLGVYMVWRGTQAWRDASGDACYIDHNRHRPAPLRRHSTGVQYASRR